MKVQVVSRHLRPLTDEELLFYKQLEPTAAPHLAAAMGLQVALDSDSEIRRRDVIKYGMLTAGGILLPSFSQRSDAWGPLAIAAGRLLLAFVVGVAASLTATGIAQAYTRRRVRGGTTDHRSVTWSRNEGGLVTTRLINSSKDFGSGSLRTELRSLEGPEKVESTDLIELDDIPPRHELELEIRQNHLPYTGKKQYLIQSSLNVKSTKFPIVVI